MLCYYYELKMVLLFFVGFACKLQMSVDALFDQCGQKHIAGYLFLWILTFIGYHILRFKTDGGSAIMLTYIIYAIFSLFSINDFLFGDMYLPLTVLPFIYLYLMLMIALSPAIYVHFHPTNKIENPNSRIPHLVSIIIIVASFLLSL